MIEGEMPPIGFIADEMLQKLGRFLRISGFDVLIPVNIGDWEFARLSHKTGRILLTRDKDLSNVKDINCVRIISDDVSIQIGELKAKGTLSKVVRTDTRCPECNSILERIKNDEKRFQDISPLIPEKVKERQTLFFYCTTCSKVYWHGKQWDNILSIIEPHDLVPE